jgi:hypothetical protein
MSAYSLETYRQLLAVLKERDAHFAEFTDAAPRPKTVYLRHDVDFSLDLAARIAEINHDEGVGATFFVLLRGHAYNLASRRSVELVERLQSLGQRVGFHYSHGHIHDDNDTELAQHVSDDFRITAELVPDLEPVWCVHTPSPTLLRRCLELDVPGLINAQAAAFVRDMPYYSDANMRYSASTWLSLAAKIERPAQLLLHPVYWAAAQPDVLSNLAVAAASSAREALYEFELNNRWRDRFDGTAPVAIGRLANDLAAEAAAGADT